MGESEVLLCPYRYLEDNIFYHYIIMVNSKNSKIQVCFYSRFLIILLPNCI